MFLLFIGNRAAAADWWPVAMHQPDTAQDSLYFLLEANTVLSAGTQTAFFISANENGNISAAPFSGNLSAGVLKPATRPNRWYDWDGAVVLTGRFDTERNTGYFQQLYAHVRHHAPLLRQSEQAAFHGRYALLRQRTTPAAHQHRH